jgi:hypothetical protein
MGNVLDSISKLLAGSEPPEVATQITAAPDKLKLEVSGVGPIQFPVSPASARRLCKAARPARYGFKDQTRLDPKVRDTWEISRDLISIDAVRWKPALAEALDRIGGVLGIPRGQHLKAQLHNLLIYAPGQFFLPHRDSEKAGGMLGTLVVTLPSRCSGGELAILHQGTKQLFGGSSTQLTLTAFYGDCRHEVRPVRRGYRVALTYNLIVQGEPARAVPASDHLDLLTGRIKEFFDTPRRPRWKGDKAPGPPERLVFLLDHQYTQAGLGWSRLKGADTASAAALREVARRLDCEICLALADVHEVWTCEDEYEDHEDWDEFGEDGEYLDEGPQHRRRNAAARKLWACHARTPGKVRSMSRASRSCRSTAGRSGGSFPRSAFRRGGCTRRSPGAVAWHGSGSRGTGPERPTVTPQ